MQAAIESFGQQMTHKYNRGDNCIVMNGYQCYLKRTRHVIAHEVQCAEKLGYNLGLKLVRGAYMREERELAQQIGLESPVFDTIEETHESYNECMKLAIEHSTPKSLVFVASHNQNSINLAKQMIVESGFTDDRVRFGQLKAFSDQITGQLAQENFKVYKYLPYGPTENVMPYLIRRG